MSDHYTQHYCTPNTIISSLLLHNHHQANDNIHSPGTCDINQHWFPTTRVKWRSLESGEWTMLSGARHQATSSQLDRTCPKTWLSDEDCTRREDGRKKDTRKTKKKDVGPTHGARGQEDQLPGVEEKRWRPNPVAPSPSEPALGQSTQERDFPPQIVIFQLLFHWLSTKAIKPI